MKLVTFERSGRQSYGAVVDDRVVDLGEHLADRFSDMRDLLSKEGLAAARQAVQSRDMSSFSFEEVRLLPPIPNPDKILCVGLNYESHRKETGRPEVSHPTLFTRFANTQIGHEAPIWVPRMSTQVDYEGELAVIVGKGGRYIPEQAALDHIAGYSCYNDVSIRDWQRHTSQFTPGKNFPHTGPFGPWIVTADEIPNPASLTLTTRLNGEVMQNATTDMLIFPIPVLINYISKFTPLEPGDVIATGTPGGVGFKRDPQIFMKAGDRVAVEITGIGILANPVADESSK